MCEMMKERARKVYSMMQKGHELVFYKRTQLGNTIITDSIDEADIISIKDSPISCTKDLYMSIAGLSDSKSIDPLASIPMIR